jgi:uncharacterized protein (TIGR03435 family)
MISTRSIAILLLVGAQTFEVATIKTTKPDNDRSWAACRGTDTGGGGPWLMGVRGKTGQTPAPPGMGRCEITGVTLKMLVGMAYDYHAPNQIDQQIVGGPKWVTSDRFDVEAKANDPAVATKDGLERMLQRLLAERFKLKVHKETRNISGYRLVVSKSGVLKKVDGPADNQPPIGGKPGDMHFNGMPLSELATFLAMQMGAPVLDKTGLSDNYSFSLHWLMSEHESRTYIDPTTPIPRDPEAPSLTTALKEQLGLKLESAKVPMPVIVIDAAEKPTEN